MQNQTEFYENEKNELSAIQLRAISALSFGDNITTVAEELNLSRQTVSSWVNSHIGFQNALRQLQAQMFDDEVRRLRGMTTRALDVIYEGLENPNYRIRLAAANKLVSALNLPALLAQESSRPPEVKAPAQLCEMCEMEKISQIMNGFDV
jgi:hypothetical protein